MRVGRTTTRAAATLAAAILGAAIVAPLDARSAATRFDVILRHGTIIDGTGAPRYRGDVGLVGDRIARIGDLSAEHAPVEIEARGLIVAPGFINIHSHAVPSALPNAENMLTQGVTTEILNPDGGGPVDIARQLTALADAGLAVNVGAYIGFNSVWATVMGLADRRPSPAAIDSMRALVTAGLEHGAFGVTSGLDYKPAYYATANEVVSIVSPAAPWRTNFTNHDRITPESGFSSRVGMTETMDIGHRAGLIPVITHMKVQGREQGSADVTLSAMRAATDRGQPVLADAYPYLAGQTALYALIIPGWAQNGGRDSMLARFHDASMRARIVTEANEAIAARFGGAEGIYLPTTSRQLTDVMREMGVTSPAEAVLRLLETESPTAILRFGAEADLVKILQFPATSIACDCGATPSGVRGHPRAYGTFPRVLGHYVRETKALTWENAIRKMTGLPASTIGLVDRGFLVPGMLADITVFDSSTVIDHSTYEEPDRRSDGMRFVLVNGRLALRDGAPTGERHGRALTRTPHMPSRVMHMAKARHVAAQGTIILDDSAHTSSTARPGLTLDVRQLANARRPTGTVRLTDASRGVSIVACELGLLQTADRWASVTGRTCADRSGVQRAFTVIVEQRDPFVPNEPATITIDVDGLPRVSGRIASGASGASGASKGTPARVTVTTAK